MGETISTWFSQRMGFEVVLTYIGNNSREVLGSAAPHSEQAMSKSFSSRIRRMIPLFTPQEERIAFNDIGQYLVVTQSSTDNVSTRLPEGMHMDVSKFRPNIVLCGPSEPFEEDFWAELEFRLAGTDQRNTSMHLTANCYRCQSITVDYKTGKPAEDESGLVWKKLNKDRRVDKGAKYSPVFGRYGFCPTGEVGKVIRVGDEVRVVKKNLQRTVFDWPALETFGVA